MKPTLTENQNAINAFNKKNRKNNDSTEKSNGKSPKGMLTEQSGI